MKKFKTGDRVRVVSVTEYAAECGILVGDEGTVVYVGSTIGVRMDKYNKNLATCFGQCENGHGWRFEKHHLELIENETPEPLENWKHPYHGKPILVRDGECSPWKQATFINYTEGFNWPIAILEKDGSMNSYRYYKFPDPTPEVPEYTMEELMEKLGHEFKIKK